MNGTGLTQRVLLVLVCCLAIIFLPLSAGAQGIIKKGAQGVQRGVETGAEKTKEGAEAVGHGAKKAITGEDTSTSRMKSTETQSTEPSQTTTPSDTNARSRSTTPSESTTTGSSSTSRSTEHRAGTKKLPRTAGELPLLALIGMLSLAAAGTSRLLRRVGVDK
jgi:uncharacterized surface anchored protein